MKVEDRAALRSFLPEQHLIRQRDVIGLAAKYYAEASDASFRDRLTIFGHPSVAISDLLDKLVISRPKSFGTITIEKGTYAVGTVDAQSDPADTPDCNEVIQIHLCPPKKGSFAPQALRDDLRTTADFISVNRAIWAAPMVYGITYGQLGRFAERRLGFQADTVHQIDPGHLLSLSTIYESFCAINGISSELQITRVQMPTDEFIERFATSVDANAV